MAYNDQSGNYKPLPFNVERDSIATRVNKQGLIEVVGKDKLRIDYTDSAKGVALLEPSRTNLITYSEDFSQWTSENATATINNETSPDGTVNATKLTPTTSIQRQCIKLAQTQIGDVVISCFAKKGEYDVIQISDARNGTYFVNFDLTNGAVGSSNTIAGEIQDYGNGWYRCIGKYNSTLSINSVRISITENSTDGRLVDFAGNGTDSLYIYGAQLEQGSYPTSYIPTNGSTYQRQADVVNGSGNSEVFNDSEGVLFADISALAQESSDRYLSLNDGSGNNRIRFGYTTPTNSVRLLVIASSSQVDITKQLSDTSLFNKFAIKYKQNDFSIWANGFEIGVDTSGNTPSGISELDFDNAANGGNFYGKTKEIGYYDATLTDSELEYLTSYRSLNELVTELNLNTL
jgi:hypothetical protein